MKLTGNTIFITGGGSGIGRGLAEELHRRGNKVIISGRRKSHLDSVAKANPGIEAIELDIADPESIHAVAKKLTTEHPDLNVLINNAGIMKPDQAAGVIDDELLVSTVTTNLLGPIRLTSALVDQLKSRRGVIVYREWIAVRKEDLCLIPDNVDDVSAAGVPVAYLTAQVALTLAGFRSGKTVLAPAIGGSIGNAVTQLARALGAKHAISSTTSHSKAEQAKTLGFNEVIDTSVEKLTDGVRRITDGYGADIIIDGIGGEVLSEAVKALAPGGSLITLGYSASRKTTIDVTSLIVSQTSIRGFNMFSQPRAIVADACKSTTSLLQSGAIKPIVAKTFPLAEAAEALRYLVEDRPFGKVVLTV